MSSLRKKLCIDKDGLKLVEKSIVQGFGWILGIMVGLTFIILILQLLLYMLR